MFLREILIIFHSHSIIQYRAYYCEIEILDYSFLQRDIRKRY